MRQPSRLLDTLRHRRKCDQCIIRELRKFELPLSRKDSRLTITQERSFLLRISSVSVIKPSGNWPIEPWQNILTKKEWNNVKFKLHRFIWIAWEVIKYFLKGSWIVGLISWFWLAGFERMCSGKNNCLPGSSYVSLCFLGTLVVFSFCFYSR